MWKKAISKNMEKLTEKICVFCAECKELYGSKVVYNDQISLHTLKRLRKKLYKLKDDEGIDFREMISIQLAEMSLETPSKTSPETPLERQSKGSRNGSIIEVPRGLSEGLIDAALTKSGKTRHFSLSSMKIEDNTVVWGHLVF